MEQRHQTRMDWKFKNQLIKTIIANGGMVFGGTARDKYLHDAHATAFYDQGGMYRDMYADPEVMQHLSGRFVTPNDIDAYICKESHARLLIALKRICPGLNEVFKRDLHKYFQDTKVAAGRVTHYRYTISAMAINTSMLECLIKELEGVLGGIHRSVRTVLYKASIHSHIDLMVATSAAVYRHVDPPFGPVDFACNSLLLDKSGFRLSRQFAVATDPYDLTKKFIDVLAQIEHKQAVLVTLKWHRVEKMRGSKWTIVGLYNEIQHVDSDSDSDSEYSKYSGHCIICHEGVHDDHFKLKCCDARYHPHCLYNAIVQGTTSMMSRRECIMCSAGTNNIKDDAVRLADYMTYNHLFPVPPAADSDN